MVCSVSGEEGGIGKRIKSLFWRKNIYMILLPQCIVGETRVKWGRALFSLIAEHNKMKLVHIGVQTPPLVAQIISYNHKLHMSSAASKKVMCLI